MAPRYSPKRPFNEPSKFLSPTSESYGSKERKVEACSLKRPLSGTQTSKLPVPTCWSTSKAPASVSHKSENGIWNGNHSKFPDSFAPRLSTSSEFPSGIPKGSLEGLNVFESAQFKLLHELVNQRSDHQATSNTSKPDLPGPSRTELGSNVPNIVPSKPCLVEQAPRVQSKAEILKSPPDFIKPPGAVPPILIPDAADFIFQPVAKSESRSDKTNSFTLSTKDGVCSPANGLNKHSFGFKSADEAFTTRSKPFSSSSTENINTKFTPEDWHGKFQAGEDYFGQDTSGQPRQSRSTTRARTRSPVKPRPMSRPQIRTHTQFANLDPETFEEFKNGERSNMSPGGTKFSPEEWAQTFKPQTFAPPPFPSPGTASRSPYPGRPGRRSRMSSSTSKPASTTSKTAGTAAMVDDDDSSDGKPLFMGPHGSVTEEPVNVGAASPNAMDIDPPLETQPPLASETAVNGARNVPVEPSRPEWRAGGGAEATTDPPSTAAGLSKEPQPTRPATTENDVEDLKINLEDLKKVEPLQQSAAGLNSFNDLTSNLPFESKAASTVPISKSFASGQLDLPKPPRAPPLPTIATNATRPNPSSWETYVNAFKAYMTEYDKFNTNMILHFVARKNQVDAYPPGWLEAFGGSNIEKYKIGLKADKHVHEWWNVAMDKHISAVTDFQWVRDVMKDGLTQTGPRPSANKP